MKDQYKVTKIQLADLEIVSIGDIETKRVVCHFLTETGFNEAVSLANKITEILNGSQKLEAENKELIELVLGWRSIALGQDTDYRCSDLIVMTDKLLKK